MKYQELKAHLATLEARGELTDETEVRVESPRGDFPCAGVYTVKRLRDKVPYLMISSFTEPS